MPRSNSGFNAMVMSAPATTSCRALSGSKPALIAMAHRMNENSPTCARLADTVSAVLTG